MKNVLTKQMTGQCEAIACTESARVVTAYLCGYSCSEMQLMPVPDGDTFFAYSLINYGADTKIALELIGETAGLHFFRSLSLTGRLQSIETAQKLSRIFVAGSVAAEVQRNSGDVHIALPLHINRYDLLKLRHIHTVLSEMMVNEEADFLENDIAQALYTMENSYVWKSINHLAAALLKHQHLDKPGIERCLCEVGLLPLYN